MTLLKTLQSLAERASHPDARKNPPQPVRILPEEIMGRTLTAQSFTSAGALIGMEVGSLAPALRPYSIAAQAGAQIFSLKANTTLPQLTLGATAQWLAQGAAVSASTPQLASAGLSPHRLTAQVVINRNLLIQTGEVAEAMLRQDFTRAIASAVDVASISGLGGAEPHGLSFNASIPSATIGGAVSLANLCTFEKTIADAYAELPLETLAWVSSSATRSKLRQKQNFTGSSVPLWTNDDRILSRPAFASSAVTGDILIFGNWSELIIAFFGAMEVTANPYDLDSTGQVRFTIDAYADCAPARATSFLRSTDSAAQ